MKELIEKLNRENAQLKHDIAYAGMLVMLELKWVEWVGNSKASLAFDFYNALRAAQDAFEARRKPPVIIPSSN